MVRLTERRALGESLSEDIERLPFSEWNTSRDIDVRRVLSSGLQVFFRRELLGFEGYEGIVNTFRCRSVGVPRQRD